MRRSLAALRNTAQSICEKLWVQGSAMLCFIATFAAVCYPATCAYGVTAVAAAYAELGWMFWLLLLDITCAAVACVTCCRWLFQIISDALSRIWSASSISLSHGAHDTVSSFSGRVNSHLGKATAFSRHTLSGALRQLKALLWLLTVYQLTLFFEVGVCCCLAHLLSPCPPVWPTTDQGFAVFLLQKWVEWFIPACFITALGRGFHVIYLVCTGSFCAAFWFAFGFGALIDAQAPPQVAHFSLHFRLLFIFPSCVQPYNVVQYVSLLCAELIGTQLH